jgi:hypothetical protein
MTLIPFPAVPAYPGVPPVPRVAPGSPAIKISISAPSSAAVPAGSAEQVWGIFSVTDNSPLYKPSGSETLSVYSFDFSRQTAVATFPVENGSFVSYDKVWSPATPGVTLAFDGDQSEKKRLLSILDAACLNTVLWNVYTPDAEYENYTIQQYSYRRMATKGATMLLIDVFLEEVKEVSLSYANANPALPSPPAISSPQSPSATPAVSSGQVQPSTPSSSTLQQAYTWIKRALGIKPPSD